MGLYLPQLLPQSGCEACLPPVRSQSCLGWAKESIAWRTTRAPAWHCRSPHGSACGIVDFRWLLRQDQRLSLAVGGSNGGTCKKKSYGPLDCLPNPHPLGNNPKEQSKCWNQNAYKRTTELLSFLLWPVYHRTEPALLDGQYSNPAGRFIGRRRNTRSIRKQILFIFYQHILKMLWLGPVQTYYPHIF